MPDRFELVVQGSSTELNELVGDLRAGGSTVAEEDRSAGLKGLGSIGEQIVAGMVVLGAEHVIRTAVALWQSRGGSRVVASPPTELDSGAPSDHGPPDDEVEPA
jgi:hypothetical protein